MIYEGTQMDFWGASRRLAKRQIQCSGIKLTFTSMRNTVWNMQISLRVLPILRKSFQIIDKFDYNLPQPLIIC